MLDEFLGLPAHPLIIHAAVVFIPLQALAAIVYAVLPRIRRAIWWAVVALAVIGPIAAWGARLSGDAFKERKVAEGANGQFLADINEHQSFGNWTSLAATALGLATLAMIYVVLPRPTGSAAPTAPTDALAAPDSADPQAPVVSVAPASGQPAWLAIVSMVVVVALAVVTAYYVARTGDSGARIVWS